MPHLASCRATNSPDEDPYTSLSPRDEWKTEICVPPPSEPGAHPRGMAPTPYSVVSVILGCHSRRRKPAPRSARSSDVPPSRPPFGPFEILARIGPMTYRLQLPAELSSLHPVFHFSNLKKCLSDVTLVIPLDEIEINENLLFIEEPVEIMDREVKRTKQSRIPIVKVRWNAKRGPEFTWEREDQMKQKYPHLF